MQSKVSPKRPEIKLFSRTRRTVLFSLANMACGRALHSSSEAGHAARCKVCSRRKGTAIYRVRVEKGRGCSTTLFFVFLAETVRKSYWYYYSSLVGHDAHNNTPTSNNGTVLSRCCTINSSSTKRTTVDHVEFSAAPVVLTEK